MYVRRKGNGWREGRGKRTRGREGEGKRGLKISICRERERERMARREESKNEAGRAR